MSYGQIGGLQFTAKHFQEFTRKWVGGSTICNEETDRNCVANQCKQCTKETAKRLIEDPQRPWKHAPYWSTDCIYRTARSPFWISTNEIETHNHSISTPVWWLTAVWCKGSTTQEPLHALEPNPSVNHTPKPSITVISRKKVYAWQSYVSMAAGTHLQFQSLKEEELPLMHWCKCK